MHKVLSWARRGLFAGATVVALGFGGAQAFAGPPAAGSGVEARWCDDLVCDRKCRANGALYGQCDPTGSCVCYEQV